MQKPVTRGRKKKDPSNAQTECVSGWFAKDEKDEIVKASAAAEIPVSTWARKVLKEAAKRTLAAMGL